MMNDIVSYMMVAGLGVSVGYFCCSIIKRHKHVPLPDILVSKDDSDDVKMVILVRTDLNMGKGKAAAQCCHACLAAFRSASRRYPSLVKAWESEGQPKVTLKVESEDELSDLEKRARAAGLVVEGIRDAGRTQVSRGTRTVAAIGPGPAKLINLVTGHLKLY